MFSTKLIFNSKNFATILHRHTPFLKKRFPSPPFPPVIEKHFFLKGINRLQYRICIDFYAWF